MSAQPNAAPPAPPKIDPETLAIRAQPSRAIRFRRGVIIAGAALGSASLMGVAWMALQPQIFKRQAQESELSQPMTKPATDALAGLPASYGDAPKLGPPLPGDLGRPILKAQQRQMATETHPQTKTDEQATLRQQQLADLKAARESGLMVQVRDGDAATTGTQSPVPVAPNMVAPQAEPIGQSRKEQFAEHHDKGTNVNAYMLMPAASPYVVAAGSVISASLITGLNSDLPGMVTAQVTQNLRHRDRQNSPRAAGCPPDWQIRQRGRLRPAPRAGRLATIDAAGWQLNPPRQYAGNRSSGLCRPRRQGRFPYLVAAQRCRDCHAARCWLGVLDHRRERSCRGDSGIGADEHADSTGAMLAINAYDEYGIPKSGNLGRFQYTGQAWIPELGLYYYKARMYSPTLGRFLQVDPIGYDDQINLYAYSGNNPVNARDPSGKKCSPLNGGACTLDSIHDGITPLNETEAKQYDHIRASLESAYKAALDLPDDAKFTVTVDLGKGVERTVTFTKSDFVSGLENKSVNLFPEGSVTLLMNSDSENINVFPGAMDPPHSNPVYEQMNSEIRQNMFLHEAPHDGPTERQVFKPGDLSTTPGDTNHRDPYNEMARDITQCVNQDLDDC